jgi:hypothetical protein
MNDPLLLTKNSRKKILLPKMEFTAEETNELDVISLVMDEMSVRSPGMIRLRNRSYKPVTIGQILMTFDPDGDEHSYTAYLGRIKYGVSDKETMKNLNYTQKVSQNYNVNQTHHVLEGVRDKFSTFEDELIKNHTVTIQTHHRFTLTLRPKEIVNLKIFKLVFRKDEGHESVFEEHLKKMHEEETQRENLYKNNNSRGAFRE